MKKLSLVLGFAFMASMVFAQNTAITKQTGTDLKATVTQGGTSNSATIDQVGINDQVTVGTNGYSNTVVVEQYGNNNGSGSVPDANKGYIMQNGHDNAATLNEGKKDGSKTAYDSDGLIDQSGNYNNATLLISGQYMNFTTHGITQIQQATWGTAGNTANITQTSFNSDMDVHQTGSGNTATGTTLGQNNQFFIDQIGKTNTATISQTGSNNGEFGYDWGTFDPQRQGNIKNWNILSQEGEDNTGYVVQASTSKFNMTQKGLTNTAKINQLGNNIVTTFQDGDRNIIAGYSSDVADFTNGASMTANQYGNDNKLYVSTAGSLTVNQGKQLVDGFRNTIKYTQSSTGPATLDQDGDDNLIWLTNTSAATAIIDVDQAGGGNVVASFAGAVASGVKSAATFAGSNLKVDQKGVGGNMLNLNSTGASIVDVMQSGSNNWASVGQSATVAP